MPRLFRGGLDYLVLGVLALIVLAVVTWSFYVKGVATGRSGLLDEQQQRHETAIVRTAEERALRIVTMGTAWPKICR